MAVRDLAGATSSMSAALIAPLATKRGPPRCPGMFNEVPRNGMKRCAHCGGKFGLVIHRWHGHRFCRAKCRERFLHQQNEKREQLKRWLEFIHQPFSPAQ
jgi:hypothetical protein